MLMIRKADRTDVSLIALLAESVQRLHYEQDPRTYKPPNASLSLGWYEDLLADPRATVFIAEDSGVPIAYAVTITKTSTDNPIKYETSFVELEEIGVVAEHQNRGVGRALHGHIVAHYRAIGVEEIRLTVIAFNESARCFYVSLGYSVASFRMSLQLETSAMGMFPVST